MRNIFENKLARGQALIVIAFGIFAVIAMIGLAVDGTHAFADRRQAQNAADAAALAAAIARVSNQNFRDAALYQLHNNGYSNDGNSSKMDVYQPPIDGAYSCQKRPADCREFIQVKLVTRVNTWFAAVVGISRLTNEVTAVSHADKSSKVPFYDGAAIVALNQVNCHAVEISGTSVTTIKGTGIYVNSNCNNLPSTNPQKAFYSGGTSLLQAPWVRVVGGAYYTPGNLNLEQSLTTGATPLVDIKQGYDLPAPICGGAGQLDPANPGRVLPGTYEDFPPDGVTSMAPGIYCVDNLKIKNDLVGGDILIVLSGGVRMESNAYISLKARKDGDFAGLLLYMPPAHQQQITINGNIASEFSGLILAPSSHVTIFGTGKAGRFTGQIVADSVTFAGSSEMEIIYAQNKVYLPTAHARIELVH